MSSREVLLRHLELSKELDYPPIDVNSKKFSSSCVLSPDGSRLTYSLSCALFNKYLSLSKDEPTEAIHNSCLYISSCISNPGGEMNVVLEENEKMISRALAGRLYMPCYESYIRLFSNLSDEYTSDEFETASKIGLLASRCSASYNFDAFDVALSCVFMSRNIPGKITIFEEHHSLSYIDLINLLKLSIPDKSLFSTKLEKSFNRVQRKKIPSQTELTKMDLGKNKKTLGRGVYGNVSSVLQDTGEFVALKTQNGFSCSFRLEIAVALTMNHQNILGIKSFLQIEEDGHITMDLLEGTLFNMLYPDQILYEHNLEREWENVYIKGIMVQRLSKKIRVSFQRDILRGLAYMHSCGIAHLDIKPENILYDKSGTLKIADFGSSCPFILGMEDVQERTTSVGTPLYIPPELLMTKKETEKYSFDVDVWSAGVVLLEIEMNLYPFKGTTDVDGVLEHMSAILGSYSGYPIRVVEPLSCVKVPELRKMLRMMMNYKSSNRPSASQCYEVLK